MTLNLEEIEGRANAATPGPWKAPPKRRYGEVVAPEHPEPDHGYEGFLVAESCRTTNAEFIAHAREDIPALVAELRRVQRERARWQALVEFRVLAGIQTRLVAADGGPWSSDMSPAEVLADLEERIISAGTQGPPPTPAEEAEAARQSQAGEARKEEQEKEVTHGAPVVMPEPGEKTGCAESNSCRAAGRAGTPPITPRAPAISDDQLRRLSALADGASDHLPVRLRTDGDTTTLIDRSGVAVADLLSAGRRRGHYIAFDRYLRDAFNLTPALVEEIQRLRGLIDDGGSSR